MPAPEELLLRKSLKRVMNVALYSHYLVSLSVLLMESRPLLWQHLGTTAIFTLQNQLVTKVLFWKQTSTTRLDRRTFVFYSESSALPTIGNFPHFLPPNQEIVY